MLRGPERASLVSSEYCVMRRPVGARLRSNAWVMCRAALRTAKHVHLAGSIDGVSEARTYSHLGSDDDSVKPVVGTTAYILCIDAGRPTLGHTMQDNKPYDPVGWHGTTILCVRRDGHVAMAGDGQVTLGQTVIKGNARKVRRIGAGNAVLAGFAGATADAFTLLERLEAKLERFPSQLERACVELAKDWRTDRYLRRLEAMMAVADAQHSYTLTGNGDVLEPEDGVIAIGSGGNYALAAARALMSMDGLEAEEIARRAMRIAGDICVYTNHSVIVETL